MSALAKLELDAPFRKAVLTDSLWGGNKSGYILHQGETPSETAPVGRVELPPGSGDRKKDLALFRAIEADVRVWERTGEFTSLIRDLG